MLRNIFFAAFLIKSLKSWFFIVKLNIIFFLWLMEGMIAKVLWSEIKHREGKLENNKCFQKFLVLFIIILHSTCVFISPLRIITLYIAHLPLTDDLVEFKEGRGTPRPPECHSWQRGRGWGAGIYWCDFCAFSHIIFAPPPLHFWIRPWRSVSNSNKTS